MFNVLGLCLFLAHSLVLGPGVPFVASFKIENSGFT